MTEQEAIWVLKDFDKQVTAKADGAYQSTIGEMACKVAISALEEIQQYRALGTVEELLEAIEKQRAKKPLGGDLISRSALMQHMRGNVLVDVTPELEKVIEKEPTTYDVDKVMEQLEEAAIKEMGITREQFNMDKGEYSSHCSLSLCDVKKIVKAGGINS